MVEEEGAQTGGGREWRLRRSNKTEHRRRLALAAPPAPPLAPRSSFYRGEKRILRVGTSKTGEGRAGAKSLVASGVEVLRGRSDWETRQGKHHRSE